MDDKQAREMKDRHSRDEAEMRRAQQVSAGVEYGPVEAHPQHGAQPREFGGTHGAAVAAYEGALRDEEAAWQRLKSGPQGSGPDAWHAWRSAVEERDRATRVLINQLLETTEGTPPAGG